MLLTYVTYMVPLIDGSSIYDAHKKSGFDLPAAMAPVHKRRTPLPLVDVHMRST